MQRRVVFGREVRLHEMFEGGHAADDDGDVDFDDGGDEDGEHVAHAVVGFF